MPQVLNNKEYNTFVKGLITEASPLTFPENASLEEDNFVLTRKGYRQRRLGLDYEEDYSFISSNLGEDDFEDVAVKVERWKDVNGNADISMYVVQVGLELYFFDAYKDSVTSSPKNGGNPLTIQGDDAQPIQTTSVAGDLVVVAGSQVVYVLSYDEDSDTVSSEKHGLLSRDIWGVDDGFNPSQIGVDEGEETLTSNTKIINDSHIYNLRNQGWDVTDLFTGAGDKGFFVTESSYLDYFYEQKGYYPSNAHVPMSGVDENDSNRFKPDLVARSLVGSNSAPRGRYIIDVFNRGLTRRIASIGESLETNYGASKWGEGVSGDYRSLSSEIGELEYDIEVPSDLSRGGIRAVESYAGRVFYSGFSAERAGGDSKSPTLSNYVFYSQVINSNDKISKCYQQGDPTVDGEDLVASDGGSISIPGMSGALALISIGKSLAVIAENGIWEITGSEEGFSATNQQVKKVTDVGAISPYSVVRTEDSIVYWSKGGIYILSIDPVSMSIVAQNVTENTIQSFYNDIPSASKFYAVGAYDPAEKTISWVFNDEESYDGVSRRNRYNRELNLDLSLTAFYTYTFNSIESDNAPYIAGVVTTPEFITIDKTDHVMVDSDQVVVDEEDVVLTDEVRTNSFSQTKYLIVKPSSSSNYSFTLGLLNNNSFLDWETEDGIGVDSPARLVTGYELLEDTQRQKQSVYLTTHFERTETGFDSNLEALNPSSCLVSARWDFADNSASGKTVTPFQAYRLRRDYLPSGVGDSFVYGKSVISTKNKLRGRGRALNLIFETEPGKDCILLGWAMVFTGNSNV